MTSYKQQDRMMNHIIDVLPEQSSLIALGICFTVLILISLRSEKLRIQVKKGIIFLIVIGCISAGYYFITGKSPTEIPAEINAFFNGPQVPEKTSHRYYGKSEKRLKESLEQ